MSKVFNMVGGGGGPAASIFVTGLSETDTVTAAKGAKTLTGKWTQKPNPALHGLPDGYTELEYIESTGTQYIDTGIYGTSDTSVEAKINVSSVTTHNPHLFYVAAGSSSSLYRYGIIYIVNSGNTIRFDYSKSMNTTVAVTFGTDNIYKIVGNQFYFNGSLVYTASDSSFTTSPYTIFIGTGNYNNDFRESSPQKLYYFKMWSDREQTNLTRDFIPCKRTSDGAVGLYDLVTNAFFGNSGSGTFTAGSEVQKTILGHLISKIKDYGTWTVTATDGTKTATKDVLVDVITDYEIEMNLSA